MSTVIDGTISLDLRKLLVDYWDGHEYLPDFTINIDTVLRSYLPFIKDETLASIPIESVDVDHTNIKNSYTRQGSDERAKYRRILGEIKYAIGRDLANEQIVKLNYEIVRVENICDWLIKIIKLDKGKHNIKGKHSSVNNKTFTEIPENFTVGNHTCSVSLIPYILIESYRDFNQAIATMKEIGMDSSLIRGDTKEKHRKIIKKIKMEGDISQDSALQELSQKYTIYMVHEHLRFYKNALTHTINNIVRDTSNMNRKVLFSDTTENLVRVTGELGKNDCEIKVKMTSDYFISRCGTEYKYCETVRIRKKSNKWNVDYVHSPEYDARVLEPDEISKIDKLLKFLVLESTSYENNYENEEFSFEI